MLNHIQRSWTKLVAPRKGRKDILRVRCLLERLEDRAMLSASIGHMPYRYTGSEFGLHSGGDQHFKNSADYSSQFQNAGGVQSQTIRYVGELGGMYGGFDLRPPMQQLLQMQPPSEMYLPGPPPKMNAIFAPSARSESDWEADLPYSNLNSAIASSQPPNLNGYNPPSSNPITFYVQISSFGARTSNDSDPGGFPKQGNQIQQQPHGSQDPYRNGNSNAANVKEFVSSLANAPAVSLIPTRETGTVAVLSALAREVAFQEFAPTLFQVNQANSYDRANLGTLGTETTLSDELDGFIRPADQANVDETAKASDTVAREREAVDAVLDELHDIDSLLPETVSKDLKFHVDVQPDIALDEMPAGEIDGGMVLLQSTGNANESGFDLTPVYADNLERFEAPAKMQTSVGMFQAVDVATDDAPMIETAPQNDATSGLKTKTKLDDNQPTKRQQSSSNKAAAFVGATTLTGALVWASRGGSRANKPEPTANKRRPSRN